MGSSNSMVGNLELIPQWAKTVSVKSKYAKDRFAGHSDGLNLITPTTIVRNRVGQRDTDAARWSRGFSSGKHVFEIVYPASHRGKAASLGVGLKSAPLHGKGKICLVGHNTVSWGIDLRSRRWRHNNKVMGKFPKSREMLNDKIYMYLDVDSGTVGFGSDERYYGIGISGIRADGEELYPMVSSCKQGSTISMVYRGEGIVIEGYLRKKRTLRTHADRLNLRCLAYRLQTLSCQS